MNVSFLPGLVDQVVTLFGKLGGVIDRTLLHAFHPTRNRLRVQFGLADT